MKLEEAPQAPKLSNNESPTAYHKMRIEEGGGRREGGGGRRQEGGGRREEGRRGGGRREEGGGRREEGRREEGGGRREEGGGGGTNLSDCIFYVISFITCCSPLYLEE